MGEGLVDDRSNDDNVVAAAAAVAAVAVEWDRWIESPRDGRQDANDCGRAARRSAVGRVTVLPSVWDMKMGKRFILILYGMVVVVGSVEGKEQ